MTLSYPNGLWVATSVHLGKLLSLHWPVAAAMLSLLLEKSPGSQGR